MEFGYYWPAHCCTGISRWTDALLAKACLERRERVVVRRLSKLLETVQVRLQAFIDRNNLMKVAQSAYRLPTTALRRLWRAEVSWSIASVRTSIGGHSVCCTATRHLMLCTLCALCHSGRRYVVLVCLYSTWRILPAKFRSTKWYVMLYLLLHLYLWL